MYTIAEIEDAIIDRLKSQILYLRTCDSAAEYLETELVELVKLCPAVLVIYEGGTYFDLPGNAQDREMFYRIFFVARNLRGDKAARHGKGSERGVYEMMEDGRAALSGQNCGLTISGLEPVDEQPEEGSRELAIYSIRFKTRCENE